MTDLAKSIRARLLNIAHDEKLTFQLVHFRYVHERLLYRLSISEYTGNFVLKGGVLLYSYSKEKTRPTKDIDFLGSNLPNELEFLKETFASICGINYLDDAVNFDPASITAEEITDQDEYHGTRLFVDAFLDTAKLRIQIDIGFGDIVIPAPVELTYPAFLPDAKPPVVQAYSLETVIAEKFEAMIDLSVANSRMKDFYDVYHILTTQQIDQDILMQAIRKTFGNRETTYNEDHSLFTPEFVTDANRITQWKAFLRKNKLDEGLEFSVVVQTILSAVPKSI
jgi:predicted nucleotidyltransferase component of viral defense system